MEQSMLQINPVNEQEISHFLRFAPVVRNDRLSIIYSSDMAGAKRQPYHPLPQLKACHFD